MVEKFLESPITKDKIVEVRRYDDTRVDTGSRTYSFQADDWLDRSDSPETLIVHNNLPFLALTINKRVTVSKLAQ